MLTRPLWLLMMIFVCLVNHPSFAQEQINCMSDFPLRVCVPRVLLEPTLDGSPQTPPMEHVDIWERVATSFILRNHRDNGSFEGNWACDWPITGGSSDVYVVWKAVWMNNHIYFFVDVDDDILDSDNSPGPASIHHDDGIHLWFERATNATAPSWLWERDDMTNYDPNTLIHNSVATNYFLLREDPEDYHSEPAPSPQFSFGRMQNTTVTPRKWSIETSVMRADGAATYAPYDEVWFEITYNDADNTSPGGIFIERDRMLSWNTRGDVPAIEGPWTHLGILQLGGTSVVKLLKLTNLHFIALMLNGFLTESVYSMNPTAIMTSSNNQPGGMGPYSYWNKYQDAAATWRTFAATDSAKLYLGFEIFDDFRDGNNATTGSNIIHDDGIILLVDVNRDGIYRPADDINVIIHNNGAIFQNNDGENYNIPYSGTAVQAAIGPLGMDPDYWVAEVKISLPPYYFFRFTDGVIRMELGYNDADSTRVREHQLFWNNVDASIQPWSNFSNLGMVLVDAQALTNPVTFSVDMRTQMQLGNFNPATHVVVVRGTFGNEASNDFVNDWEGNFFVLSESEIPGVYTGRWIIASAGNYTYKFYIVDANERDNFSSTGGIGETINSRQLNVPPGGIVLPTVSFNNDAPVGVKNSPSGNLPKAFALGDNYPNPFNPSTQIAYDIPQATHVVITVCDALGRHVVTLVDARHQPGSYAIEWNGFDSKGKPVGSGVYLYSIKAESFSQAKKMLLMR